DSLGPMVDVELGRRESKRRYAEPHDGQQRDRPGHDHGCHHDDDPHGAPSSLSPRPPGFHCCTHPRSSPRDHGVTIGERRPCETGGMRRLAVLAVIAALGLCACSSSGSKSGSPKGGASSTTLAPPVAAKAYEQAGPHPVGVTTYTLPAGNQVEVW